MEPLSPLRESRRGYRTEGPFPEAVVGASTSAFWEIDSTPCRAGHPVATTPLPQCNDLQTGKVLQREVSASRRAPLAVVSDDSADDARPRIQSTPVEGGYGP